MRNIKLAQAIRHEVSDILHDELNDPRIGFITVTRVDVTPDCRYARIYYSIYGGKKDKDKTEKGINSARGFVRKLIGERIRMKFVPEIEFKLDESIEYSIHIDELFKKIKKG